MNKRIERFIELMVADTELRNKHRCGVGSSREAYRLGDLIIKLPRNFFGGDEEYGLSEEQEYDEEELFHGQVSEMGILQTEKEIEVWENASILERKILATIYCHGKINGVPYLVMEEITTAHDLNIFSYESEIGKIAKERGFRLAPVYERIVGRFSDKYNLVRMDLFGNSGNYGITKDKKVVLCDYGFCGWSRQEYGY